MSLLPLAPARIRAVLPHQFRAATRAVAWSRSRAQGRVSRSAGARRDIQGLRAFAVLAVIAHHLTGRPAGGFVGVDIFFVISGFLITGLLLREYEQTGHISFVGFYRRRARRILPAALVVLVATLAVSWLVFNRPRFLTTAQDAVASAFFVGNWRFALVGTDYFQADGPVSPLRHFWSLGVEEQFYLVWPWLLLGLFALFVRPRSGARAARVVAAAGILVIGVGSYLWASGQTADAPTMAYFSTLTRAWELAVGAALAVAARQCRRIPDRLRPALGWIGLAGMVVAVFTVREDAGFPVPGAVLPVLATALVIAAGTGTERRSSLVPLTNPVAGYLGDISYSLYLWHFPVIVIVGAAIGPIEGIWSSFAVCLVILLLSVYSYHLVEDPIRRGVRWRRRPSEPRPGGQSPHYRLLTLSLLGVVTLGLCALALRSTPAPVAVAGPVLPAIADAGTKASTVEYGPEVARLQTQIGAALGRSTWPRLDPSMDDAIAAATPAENTRCGRPDPLPVADCTFGPASASKTAVLIGDSVALSYLTTLRPSLGPDWKLISYATPGCAFVAVDVPSSDPEVNAKCPAKKAEAVQAIRDLQPDLVVITNNYERHGNLTAAQWRSSLTDFVATFRSAAGKVVLLAPPPADVDINDCYTSTSQPGDCVSRLRPQWLEMAKVERAVATRTKSIWLDPRPLFCDARLLCPSFVGPTPVKKDRVHLTNAYADEIGPGLSELFQKRKVDLG